MFIIIGASGYLGAYFIKELEGQNIIATYSNEKLPTRSEHTKWLKLDLKNSKNIDTFIETVNLIEEEKTVIFLAATHHPDIVKKDPEAAKIVNIDALGKILRGLRNINNLYYSSTDNVYGESRHNETGELIAFDEADEVKPFNEYGRQKKAAEDIVIAHGYTVIRYSLLMGPSLVPHKKHFFDTIVSKCIEKSEMELIGDSYRSCIDFKQAALLTLQLIERLKTKGEKLKIINIAGDDNLSKYEIGAQICKANQLDSTSLKSIPFENVGFFNEKRPQSIIISNKQLKNILGIEKIIADLNENFLIQFIKPEFEHYDNRGGLTQLVSSGWSQVNVIQSEKGTIRGNHYHKYNTEAFYIIEGSLKLILNYNNVLQEFIINPKDMFIIKPYVHHIFEFLKDTLLVSMYDKGVEMGSTKDIYTI